jgi:hypothetical protein
MVTPSLSILLQGAHQAPAVERCRPDRCQMNAPRSSTWRAAFVARRVGHVGGQENLAARTYEHSVLQVVAVINYAFAPEQIGDRFDPLVIVRVCPRAGRHRQDVHANLFGANSFGGSARTIGEP